MDIKKKAWLLSSIVSLATLCGCGSSSGTQDTNTLVTVDGEQYIQNGNEYTKLDITPKRFEEGTHIIHYVDIPVSKRSTISDNKINQGFGNSAFAIDDIPEGYKLAGVTSYSNSNGNSYFIVYVYVNEVPVIAEGSYDINSNTVVYETPGKVIKEQAMTLEP